MIILETMTCPRCDKKLPGPVNICSRCGKHLKPDRKRSSPQTANQGCLSLLMAGLLGTVASGALGFYFIS